MAFNKKNPNGVYYIHKAGDALSVENVIFQANSIIKIEIESIGEDFGFSRDLFFQTVVESFRVTK